MYLRHLVLLIPVFLMLFLDATLTLSGQPEAYWLGDSSQVNEGSPDFKALLAIDPLAFVLGAVGWLGIVALLLILLPRSLAFSVSAIVTIGHSVGASTWLLHRGTAYDYQLSMLMCAVIGVVLSLAFTQTYHLTEQYRPARELSLKVRLCLLLVIFAVPLYMFLIPH